ncbi:MAG: hypothetical protein ACFFDX_16740 [Candidatus Odinarchaeota archaeon]
MFKILLIGIGDDNQYLRIPQLCLLFNSVQNYYNFNEGKKNNISNEKSHLSRSELIEWAKNNIDTSAYDLVFLIHDFQDDSNWFATNPIEKISLCSTDGWVDVTNEIDVTYSIGSSIIQIIQAVEIYKDKKMASQEYLEDLYDRHEELSPKELELIHFKTIGCLNDFCAFKEDKIFRMRTGHVCKDCIKIWEEKNLNSNQIDALFEMIEAVRIKSVINKSNIRNRSYCRDLISNIEKLIHDKIQQNLKNKFGDGWWVEGVKKDIRKKISAMFEENDCCGDKFDYTSILDLKHIWVKNLSWISKYSPFKEWQTNENIIKRDFIKLNRIRNFLMHSTRDYDPSDEDKKFLEGFAKKIFS